MPFILKANYMCLSTVFPKIWYLIFYAAYGLQTYRSKHWELHELLKILKGWLIAA